MSHIYVTNNGSTVSLDGGRIVIRKKDEVIKSVPRETIESVSIFGNSSITTPCTHYLLTAGIPVCYYSSKGKFYGRLVSTAYNKVDILRSQISAFDDVEYAIQMSKQIVRAKINNQEVVLRRYVKEPTEQLQENIKYMKIYREKVESTDNENQIMGYEGIAARTYFDSLSEIIKPDFSFKGRSKRPPRDKFNSLLSLGYTLLLYEIYAKLQNEGLTPYYSIFHKSYRDHPALASDMMEEWRSVIVDSIALSMVQGNEIKAEEFEGNSEDGVFLSNNGLKKFLKKYEMKMNTEIKYLPYDNSSYSIRDALSVQCKYLKMSISDRDPALYKPIMIR